MLLDVVTLASGNQVVRVVDQRPVPPAPRRSGGVQWYVPYTVVHSQVVEAAPANTIWVDVSADPDAYWAALAAMWERGESFAVLEHDVICRPDVEGQFEVCPDPWCIFGYSNICHPECMEGWRNALGCTRFTAEIIHAAPDAVSAIPPERRDWHNVCDGLGDNLRAAGFSHHWHFPWVDHHPWTTR